MKPRRLIAVVVSVALLFNSGAGMASMQAQPADAGEMQASSHCAEMASVETAADPQRDSGSAGDCCADGHCPCVVHAHVTAPLAATAPGPSASREPLSPPGDFSSVRPDDPLRPPIH